jgi:aarF domain-containing kinase
LSLRTEVDYPDFCDVRILYEEIDYINEGKNADRFRRDFRNIKWVRVPVRLLDLKCSSFGVLFQYSAVKISKDI